MRNQWRGIFVALFLAGLLGAGTASAQSERFILRTRTDLLGTVLSRHALTLSEVLRETDDALVLVDKPLDRTVEALEAEMALDLDVEGFERDRRIEVSERLSATRLTQSTTAILEALGPTSRVGYWGSTVPASYAAQPTWSILELAQSQGVATGNTVVAVIDTGVDATHPLIRNVVVPGYDFIRNVAGTASDLFDLPQSTTAILEQSTTAILEERHVVVLNQSTAVALGQSTTAILEGLPPAFGHGTMVAGLIHYVAPTARIMPLKAFHADGSSDLSDILRAIYYAVDNGARIINMSFSTPTASGEMSHALNYAVKRRVIPVAAAGNEGQIVKMFPSADSKAIGVGSVSTTDQRSVFSNYGGTSNVRIATPGEVLVSSYPVGHWAAVSGTSFSSGLTSGVVAMMLQANPKMSFSEVVRNISSGAVPVPGFADGRINLSSVLSTTLQRR